MNCILCSSICSKENSSTQLIQLEDNTIETIQMYKLKCSKCIWISANLPATIRPINSKIISIL
jgi:hypothetical protein